MKKVLTFPVFNEAQTIQSFVTEIFDLHFFDQIVVVNDCSTDNTKSILEDIESDKLILINNTINLGHGPSTLRGMLEAFDLGSDFIVTADGDGHFEVSDLKHMVLNLSNSSFDVIEGVRINREDPWFRKISSLLTRFLVRSRSKRNVKDANTPLRAYRSKVLGDILQKMPGFNYPIPNLYISAVLRKSNFKIMEFEVSTAKRYQSNALGSTWEQKHRSIPTKKYLRFCLKAITYWYFRR